MSATPEANMKEASIEPGRRLKGFVCNNCKGTFYANNAKNIFVLCPHCKTKAVLPEKEPSGWGTFISLLFAIGGLFSRGKR